MNTLCDIAGLRLIEVSYHEIRGFEYLREKPIDASAQSPKWLSRPRSVSAISAIWSRDVITNVSRSATMCALLLALIQTFSCNLNYTSGVAVLGEFSQEQKLAMADKLIHKITSQDGLLELKANFPDLSDADLADIQIYKSIGKPIPTPDGQNDVYINIRVKRRFPHFNEQAIGIFLQAKIQRELKELQERQQ